MWLNMSWKQNKHSLFLLQFLPYLHSVMDWDLRRVCQMLPNGPQNSGWPPGSPTSPPSPSSPLTFFRCSFCLSRNSSRLRSSSRRARASWMCALPTFSVSRVTVWPLPGPVCHPHFTSHPSHPPSAFQPGTELDRSPSTHLLTQSPLQRLRVFQETLMALLPRWGWLELTLLQGVKGGPQGTAKQKSRSASRHAAGARTSFLAHDPFILEGGP